MDRPEKGTKVTISLAKNSPKYTAEIADIHDVEMDDGTKGWLILYKVDGVLANGQPYYYESWFNLRNNASGRMSASCMPSEYAAKMARDFKWDKYSVDTSSAKSVASAFIMRFEEFRRQGRGFYIYSKTKGSGKTLLACCLANEVMSRYSVTAKFVSAAEYIELYKRRETDRCQIFKTASLLVLDDYGVQGRQDWVNEVMFALIDYRYSNNLMTMFTSNVPLSSIKVGNDREYSRINRCSIELKLPEQSIRDDDSNRFKDEFLKEVLKDEAI